MIVLKSKTIKSSKKDHVCDFCNFPIIKGQSYKYDACKYDDFYIWKSHLHCIKFCEITDLYYDNDEGVTQETFCTEIREQFKELTIDDKNLDVDDSSFEYQFKTVLQSLEIDII